MSGELSMSRSRYSLENFPWPAGAGCATAIVPTQLLGVIGCVSWGPDEAPTPPRGYRYTFPLFAGQAQKDLHRILKFLDRPHLEDAGRHGGVEDFLSFRTSEDGDRPIHGADAPARDVSQLAGKVRAVVTLGTRML